MTTPGALQPNTLYYGDCLEWLPRFPADSVDLIYLDPPFNSNTSYNLLFGNGGPKRNGGRSAQVRAFDDTWRWDDAAARRVDRLARAAAHPAHKAVVGLRTMIGEGGMLAYLSYMAERLAAMRHVLKPSGSIYLHCDPTASHGLKLVMDTIFGPRNFRNEIVWQRSNAHNMKAKAFVRINDVILFYSATDSYRFNPLYTGYSKAQLKRYKRDDSGRLYTGQDLTFGTVNESRQFSWRGTKPPENRSWGASREQLERWYADGRILLKKDGTPRLDGKKVFLDEKPGKPVATNWTDIPRIGNTSKERLGYPTQKPLALLSRIIEASSNEGDMVLDPFCGCGTAVAAAHKLNRRWAGIDISPFAIDLIAQKRFPEFKVPTEGYPYDLAGAAKLAREQPFKFEKWAVTRVPGLAPNDQQIGDGGIDGVGYLLAKPENGETDQVLAQVKGGKYQLGQLRDFLGVVEREKAAMGVYATVNPISAPGAHAEAAKRGKLRLGATEYPRAQLWSIHDYFDDRMPHLPALADPYTGKPVQGSLQMTL